MQNALVIYNFEEVILHFYDIGMVELRNDGKLSIFILGVLHNFFQSVLFAGLFIDNLCKVMGTR